MDELEVTKMSLNLANGLIKVLTERITYRDNIIKRLRKEIKELKETQMEE